MACNNLQIEICKIIISKKLAEKCKYEFARKTINERDILPVNTRISVLNHLNTFKKRIHLIVRASVVFSVSCIVATSKLNNAIWNAKLAFGTDL